MPYQIQAIDLFVRRIPPPRMDFSIGKGQSLFPAWMRGNVEVRLRMSSPDGNPSYGCAADWPSFGWLDKRADVEPKQKMLELLALIERARQVFLQLPPFDSAFEGWWQAHRQFNRELTTQPSVPLCATFALALIERALIDAMCRSCGLSFFEMLKQRRLGVRVEAIHPELGNFDLAGSLPDRPRPELFIRHTVGLGDPLTDDDLTVDNRIDDGLPQTLQQYVQQQELRYFKVKVCGNEDEDFRRLQRIWQLIADVDPTITLDGNESFATVERLLGFVDRLAKQSPRLFERILLIEQPLSRAMTLDESTTETIRQVAKQKPLIIDEADDDLHAFRSGMDIGYAGVSHKNCKGVFKSLANHALCKSRSDENHRYFLSAEDLTNMPLVAFHQDSAVVAALGLTHAERNAHHFFSALSHLTPRERNTALANYGQLYANSHGDVRLNIRKGKIDVSALQCAGLGIDEIPDWDCMSPLNDWIRELETG